jgi:gamma-glutamylcyclotransferase (GGCT)/AIG2-like uncharacterized protein YtfP
MNDLLFVCGTLLPELAPAAMQEILARCQFIGAGFVRGRLYDLGEYPGGVIDESADTLIVGKIISLPADQSVLKTLDEYEGFDPQSPHAGLFIRTRCTVTTPDGQKQSCWIYAYNGSVDGLPLIGSGDYLKYREQIERKT